MLAPYTKKFVYYLRHSRAVSALEYAILVGIVATALATAIGTFGGQIGGAITDWGKAIKDAGEPTIDLGG